MRPITSANLTSPCKLSEPHPSTVMVLPVTVAPAEQAMHLMTLHNHTTKSYISFVDTLTNFCTACVKQWSALIIACKALQNSTLNMWEYYGHDCNTTDVLDTSPGTQTAKQNWGLYYIQMADDSCMADYCTSCMHKLHWKSSCAEVSTHTQPTNQSLPSSLLGKLQKCRVA